MKKIIWNLLIYVPMLFGIGIILYTLSYPIRYGYSLSSTKQYICIAVAFLCCVVSCCSALYYEKQEGNL